MQWILTVLFGALSTIIWMGDRDDKGAVEKAEHEWDTKTLTGTYSIPSSFTREVFAICCAEGATRELIDYFIASEDKLEWKAHCNNTQRDHKVNSS